MMIKISRYPVFIHIGCSAAERLPGQDVYISLKATLSGYVEGQLEDDVTATVDYAKMMATIDATLGGKEIKLVETVLERASLALMQAFPRIETLTLKVEKPVIPGNVNKGARIECQHTYHKKSNNF